MHLEGNHTTHDIYAYIVYIANEVELTSRCGIQYRAPVKQSDVFLFLILL